MKLYCDQENGKRGRPKTTLPVVLWNEAKKVLKKQPSLTWFTNLAQDRKAWFEFSESLLKV